jgi:Tol biopolymer transport system component
MPVPLLRSLTLALATIGVAAPAATAEGIRIAGTDGSVRVIDEHALPSAVAWSPRGDRLAFLRETGLGASSLSSIGLDGTGVARLDSRGAGVSNLGPPQWSPSGALLAYSVGRSAGNELVVIGADGSGRRVLAPSLGEPGGNYEWPPFAWSPDSRRIAYRDGRSRLFVVDVATGARRQLARAVRQETPSWARDGRRLVAVAGEHNQSWVIVFDAVAGRELKRIRRYEIEASGTSPVWSPDDSRIAFVDVFRDPARLVVVQVASGAARTMCADADNFAWAPDSSRLACSHRAGKPDRLGERLAQLDVMRRDGAHVQRITRTRTRHQLIDAVAWAPRGAHLAYVVSNVDAYDFRVVLHPFNGGRDRRLGIGIRGDYMWAPDGTRVAIT